MAVGTPYHDRDPIDDNHLIELGMQPWYDFLSTPDQQWIVDDLLPAGRQTHLIAPAGVGKTLLAHGMVIAIMEGRQFAGRYDTQPARILWLDYENGWQIIQDRFASFGYEDDMGRFELESILFFRQKLIYWPFPSTSYLPPLNTAEGAAALVEICEAFDIDLVIVDSMSLALEGDENSADTYRDFGRHTGKAMRERDIAMLLLDNTGKNEQKGARGSSRKKDEADLQWKLGSQPNGYSLKQGKDRLGGAPKIVNLQLKEDPQLHWSTERTSRVTDKALRIVRQMQADGYQPQSRRQAQADGYRGSAQHLGEAVNWLKSNT